MSLTRKLKLYQTSSKYYLVGENADRKTYKVLNFTRVQVRSDWPYSHSRTHSDDLSSLCAWKAVLGRLTRWQWWSPSEFACDLPSHAKAGEVPFHSSIRLAHFCSASFLYAYCLTEAQKIHLKPVGIASLILGNVHTKKRVLSTRPYQSLEPIAGTWAGCPWWGH